MKSVSTSNKAVSQISVERPDTAARTNSSQVFEPRMDDQELHKRKIAEAAYYRAEARGFATGYEWEDWLAAEAELYQPLQDAALGSGPL